VLWIALGSGLGCGKCALWYMDEHTAVGNGSGSVR